MTGFDTIVNLASFGFGHAEAILHATQKAGIRRAIFISTTAIFTQLNPRSKCVRLAAERAIETSGLQYTILRPTMIYGSRRDRNMWRLIRFMRVFPIVPVFGDGTYLQQPIYVEDVAHDVPVRIEKSGKGMLYYNMNLKYYLPFEEVEPMEAGIVVIREFVGKNGKIMKATEPRSGDELWVRLIILAPAMIHHVIIEDKLPAGLEAVNESLATSSLLNVEKLKVPKDREVLYFRHQEIRDDRVVLFAETLPIGVYEYTYRVSPTTPGRYHHPPAQAYNMYIPDISKAIRREVGWK